MRPLAASPRRDLVATMIDAIVGVLVLSGIGTRWVRAGNGSTLTGLDLADQLIGGAVVPRWGTAAGLSLYAVVGVGALLVVTSPWRAWPVAAGRLLMCVAVVAGLAWLSNTGRFEVGNWGPAVWATLIAVVVAAASNTWSLVARIRRAGATPVGGSLPDR